MRSGFVLMTVLGILVLVLATATAAVLSVGMARHDTAAHGDRQRLTDGLRAGEAIALAWMQSRAAAALAGPEGGGITVAHDRCATPSGILDVQVDAYDMLAQVPWSQLAGGGRLRQAVPVPVVRALVPAVARGISDWSLVPSTPGCRVFPVPSPAPADRYGNQELASARPWSTGVPTMALWASPRADGRININTASPAVLTAAFADLGIDGVSTVLEQRKKGQRALLPETPTASHSTVTLIETSDRWSFLISVEWNGCSRQWWIAMVGNGGTASIVQRHDADR